MVTQEELEKMSPEEIAELQRKNCIFCKIIAGEVPSHKVFNNDLVHSFLDIRPAKKGHVVIAPTQHAPIMPLLSPESFQGVFQSILTIDPSLKKETLSSSSSVFIANGPAAGQQASHFLIHLIAREEGDALSDKFSFTPRPDLKEKNDQLIPVLSKNLPLMLKNHAQKTGLTKFFSQPKTSDQQPSPSTVSHNEPAGQPSGQSQEELIVQFFDNYPQAKLLLEQDLDQFKELLREREELQKLFQGVNLEQLAKSFSESPKHPRFQEIFQGDDPNKQLLTLAEYFSGKPAALDLLVSDVDKFVSLLSSRPDVASLFKQVNIPLLSQHAFELFPNISTIPQQIFKGDNSANQFNDLKQYFSGKPAALDLLVSDVDKFVSLLSSRSDVAPLFENVDIPLLAKHARQLFGGDES